MKRPPGRAAQAPRRVAERSARVAAPPAAEPRWAAPAAWLVAALFAAALLAMILGPHRVGDVFTETDFYGAYGEGARLIQHGHVDPGRYAVVGPLFEATLALVGFAVRDLFLAAELIALVSMTGALLLWGAILRRLSGGGLALLAMLFLATNATFFRFGYSATTDALALALQAAALALLLRAATPLALAAAGFVAGLAFLTRYSGIALVPAGLVAIAAGWAPGAAERPKRLGAALAYGAGFVTIVAPWVAFSLAHGGAFQVQLHHNIAYDVFARAKGIPWDTYQRTMQSQFPTPWSVWSRDPGAVTARMLSNVATHVALDARLLVGLPVAACAALGLAAAWRDRTLGRLAPVLALGAFGFAALVPAFHAPRYSLALLPAWAALAAAAFGSAAVANPLARRAGIVVAGLVLALALRTSVASQARVLDQLPVEVLEAARGIAPLARPGDRVIARKPHFAWHAGLEPVAFPFADSLPQLARYARERHVRWLYFSWPEAELRPALSHLLDTSGVVPGLTPRVVTAHHPAVVYEIGPGFGAPPAWAGDPLLAAVHHARARVLTTTNDLRSRMLLATYAINHGEQADGERWLGEARALVPRATDVATLRSMVEVYETVGDPATAAAVRRRLSELGVPN